MYVRVEPAERTFWIHPPAGDIGPPKPASGNIASPGLSLRIRQLQIPLLLAHQAGNKPAPEPRQRDLGALDSGQPRSRLCRRLPGQVRRHVRMHTGNPARSSEPRGSADFNEVS